MMANTFEKREALAIENWHLFVNREELLNRSLSAGIAALSSMNKLSKTCSPMRAPCSVITCASLLSSWSPAGSLSSYDPWISDAFGFFSFFVFVLDLHYCHYCSRSHPFRKMASLLVLDHIIRFFANLEKFWISQMLNLLILNSEFAKPLQKN